MSEVRIFKDITEIDVTDMYTVRKHCHTDYTSNNNN